MPRWRTLGHDHRTDARLRLSRGSSVLETSGGIVIGLNDQNRAQLERIWKFVQAIKAGKMTFDPGRKPIALQARITSHRIESIDEHGFIRSGCHGIQYATLRRVAIKLGFERPTLLERVGIGG